MLLLHTGFCVITAESKNINLTRPRMAWLKTGRSRPTVQCSVSDSRMNAPGRPGLPSRSWQRDLPRRPPRCRSTTRRVRGSTAFYCGRIGGHALRTGRSSGFSFRESSLRLVVSFFPHFSRFAKSFSFSFSTFLETGMVKTPPPNGHARFLANANVYGRSLNRLDVNG